MNKINIGDELQLIPKTFYNTENVDGTNHYPKKPLPGKVTYIHPKGRFIIAEFKLGGGTVKESFKLSELEGYEL